MEVRMNFISLISRCTISCPLLNHLGDCQWDSRRSLWLLLGSAPSLSFPGSRSLWSSSLSPRNDAVLSDTCAPAGRRGGASSGDNHAERDPFAVFRGIVGKTTILWGSRVFPDFCLLAQERERNPMERFHPRECTEPTQGWAVLGNGF